MKKQFDRKALSTLINTNPIPSGYYGRIFDWFWAFRGAKLEYGFNLPTESFTTNIQGIAPFTIFKTFQGQWSAVAVISVTAVPQPVLDHRAYNTYLPNSIEYIHLSEAIIDAGYLETRAWKTKAKQAVYSPCTAKPFKLPALVDIRNMNTVANISS